MEVTMKIEGMMCGHCSGRVKAALEKLKGESLEPAALKAAVEAQGYDVVG